MKYFISKAKNATLSFSDSVEDSFAYKLDFGFNKTNWRGYIWFKIKQDIKLIRSWWSI